MTGAHHQPLAHEAHRRLDLVREGAEATRAEINACLLITGDLINFREFTDDGEPVIYLENPMTQQRPARASEGVA